MPQQGPLSQEGEQASADDKGGKEGQVRADGCIVVAVADDGVGGAIASPGSGLSGLADRVAALGGRLEIDSPAGGGTRLRAEIPCASS